MNKLNIKKLLIDVKDEVVGIGEALSQLDSLPYKDLGFAKLDNSRESRTGYPEVLFCKGKTNDQIKNIFLSMAESKNQSFVMATKATSENFDHIKTASPSAIYYETARIVALGKSNAPKKIRDILVLTAGTSDIPIAEEAAVTTELLGNNVIRSFDVGVAGLQRIIDQRENFEKVSAIIIVAGMEGALVSVVSGMTDKPVIAVPTSIGYGSSFEGLAALLAMLNSCAPGVAVMNIDNGFGAGYFVSIMG